MFYNAEFCISVSCSEKEKEREKEREIEREMERDKENEREKPSVTGQQLSLYYLSNQRANHI